MKNTKRKITALLLALCMLLGLAACGGSSEGDGETQQLSGVVYVPEFMNLDLNLGKNSDIRGGCTDGKNVYLLASIYPDWEAGEEGDTRYAIVRVPLDGGEPTELENFQLMSKPEGYDEGNVYINSIKAGADGTLWVNENVYANKYDLPENFDPETDQIWNYDVLESVDNEYQVQLDSTGNVITQVDISGLREKAGVEYLYSDGATIDKDGDLFVGSEGKIVVLDSGLNVLFTLEDSNLWGGDMVMLSDGTIGTVVTVSDPANNSYKRELRTIDKTAKDWGTAYSLPQNAYEVYPGGGDYLFYYKNGDTLYGYKAGAPEGTDPEERLLSWLESDINSDDIQFFSFLPDGRLVVMTQSWRYNGNREMNLAVLTATDRSQIPEKTILTYATMYLGSDERNRILDFNKNSTTHRIEVRDYSEYSTDEDYYAGITKLNTEIIAGQVPDIISTDSLPVRQYGAKGLLEDLWPYIEADSEIGGRAGVMDRVFAAAEQEGKLYQVFNSFTIRTVIGSRKVVGDRMSWTLGDLKDALATMPEGCAIFGEGDTKTDMLRSVLAMNIDSYLDWENGTCSFDSDNFKAVLEFCNSFPAEFDWEKYEYDDNNSEPARIADGRQMLMEYSLSSFEGLQLYEAIFGGAEALNSFYLDYSGDSPVATDTPPQNDWGRGEPENRLIPGRYISYIGYPMEDGSCGSSFMVSGGLALSSTCKDKETAWSFMRQLLLPVPDDEEWGYNHWGFPTNKSDFEKQVEAAMKVEYMTDAEGNQILDLNGDPIQDSRGGYGYGNLMVDTQATTQEEYDQFMELYNAVDTIYSSDNSIFDIISEVAGSYFAGDRTLDDAAGLIQNKVNIYVNENR